MNTSFVLLQMVAHCYYVRSVPPACTVGEYSSVISLSILVGRLAVHMTWCVTIMVCCTVVVTSGGQACISKTVSDLSTG